MDFKLTRNERLSGLKRIEYLFAKGRYFHLSGFKATWIFITEEEMVHPVQIMFSAPKKKFRKAVTRNRLKRLMREGYRKNKSELYTFLKSNEKNIHLSLVFTGEKDISSVETEDKIILTLRRLIKEIKSSLDK